MPNLNRFPLLGLWAREAAHRIGFSDPEADTLGHAYAVLYAIRADSPSRPGAVYKDKEARDAAAAAAAHPADLESLPFGGDRLEVSRDPHGRLVGRVGRALPQTPETYRYKVVSKFPTGYHEKLQSAFRALLEAYTPAQLNGKLVYSLYDQWKKQCAAGRLVDLDNLLKWCQDKTPAAK